MMVSFAQEMLGYLVPSRKATRSFLFVLLLSTAVYSLLIMAIVSYIGVYMYYIPYGHVLQTVDLDFSGPRNAAYGALDVGKVPLINNNRVHYSVGIELVLPRDHHNRALGNFMVRMSRLDPQNIDGLKLSSGIKQGKWPLTHALMSDRLISPALNTMTTKPAILPHKSMIRESLELLVFSPLFLTGLKSEQEKLYIDMGKWEATKGLHLLIELDRDVHIASAGVRWTVHLTGLRYLMQEFRFSMAVIGTLFFWFVEVVFALLITWLVLTKYSKTIEPERAPALQIEAPEVEEFTDDVPDELVTSNLEPTLLNQLGADPDRTVNTDAESATLTGSASTPELGEHSPTMDTATLAETDYSLPTPAATPERIYEDDEEDNYVDRRKSEDDDDENENDSRGTSTGADVEEGQGSSSSSEQVQDIVSNSSNNNLTPATSTSRSSGDSNPWRRVARKN